MTASRPLSPLTNNINQAEMMPITRSTRSSSYSLSYSSSIVGGGAGKTTSSSNATTRRNLPWVWLLASLVVSWMGLCPSEAFASTHSRFAGRALDWRGGGGGGGGGGGSSEQQQRPSSSTTTSSTSNSGGGMSSLSPLTCVMQAPPGVVDLLTQFQPPEDERFGKKNGYNGSLLRKNGVSSSGTTTTSSSNGQLNHKKYPTPVEYVAETKLPTDIGQFQLRAYRIPGAPLGQEPCVIYSRDRPPFGYDHGSGASRNVPVRIHDQCLTSEVFRSQRCDCKEQLHMALNYILKNGGCIIYLQQEGRGIGLANKIAAYALQDIGFDTVDANLHLGFPEDSREYGVVPSILDDMKIASIQLMTNNPRKTKLLTELGVEVECTLPMVIPSVNPFNRQYMETKRMRMHHENLSTLLSQSTVQAPFTNRIMAPRKHLATEYINNGTEMSANAVQVSLMVEDTQSTAHPVDVEEEGEAPGVQATSDGYCFGKQSVVDAIDAIRRGEMVVVVDDMNRENEGDFIMAADQVTDLDMARIVRFSSGVVCVAMEGHRMDELQIPPMTVNNEDPKGTAFGVSVDATKAHGISTGISASDRAKTVQLLANPSATAIDFHRPGHIFPLRAREGGVLARDGHTEASVDLARLAGRSPCGLLCEIVSEENPTEMMRLPELKRFSKRHGFVMTSIVDIAQYRRETESAN